MLRDKIREYFEVTGTVSNMTKVIDSAQTYMLNQMKASMPEEQLAEIKQLNDKYMLIMKGRIDEFTEKFVNLYAEYYTEEDMDALLAYNKSPVAKKVQEVHGKIMDRAMEISGDFNKELLKQLDGATLSREIN
jgi:hypothetical protein